MKSLSDLQADTAINLATTGAEIKGGYPDNEWGIMLAHFDSCVAVYRHAKVETKNQGLQRDYVTSQARNMNDGNWGAWNDDNPDTPTLPHHPVTYEASVDACAYFADPPPPLRDCLSVLANGGELSEEDWLIFLLMYGEFRGHLSVLHARNPDVDALAPQRGARKYNRDRHKAYAALFIKGQLENHRAPSVAKARPTFLTHVGLILDGYDLPPEGWTKEDFIEFIQNPDAEVRRLKKAYDQNMTLKEIQKWVKPD